MKNQSKKTTKKEIPDAPIQEAPLITYETIEIKGKAYDLAFDLVAFDLYTSKVREYKLSSEFNTGHFTLLIQAGLDAYSFMHEKPVNVSTLDIHETVLELAATDQGNTKLFKIVQSFVECRAMAGAKTAAFIAHA